MLFLVSLVSCVFLGSRSENAQDGQSQHAHAAQSSSVNKPVEFLTFLEASYLAHRTLKHSPKQTLLK